MSTRSAQGILLLSVGSKAALVRIARQSARARGLTLHATDVNANVPGRFEADAFACFDPNDRDLWIESILNYCRRHEIRLVIPTRHGDLPYLAAAAARFAAENIGLCVSSRETIATCFDKLSAYRFLRGIEADAAETSLKSEFNGGPLEGRFPLFAKPRDGAGSSGARAIRSPSELQQVPDDWILQELLEGPEFTVYLYLDRRGRALCSIPQARLAVESGEVSQAQTRRIPVLEAETRRICESLPGAQGIFNVQAILDRASGKYCIVEINPRVGGGFPLAHQAKGKYIEWLCQEWLDEAAPRPTEEWTNNLVMLRYREAHFEIQPAL